MEVNIDEVQSDIFVEYGYSWYLTTYASGMGFLSFI